MFPLATLIKDNGQVRMLLWPETEYSDSMYAIYRLRDGAAHLTRSRGHAEKIFGRWTKQARWARHSPQDVVPDGAGGSHSAREDVIAAKVFVRALPAESLDELQAELLKKIKRGDETPDPTTRLGLALIAFTAPDIDIAEDESATAWERVSPLWTQQELQFIEEMVRRGAELVFEEAMKELEHEYVMDGDGTIRRRTDV